MQNLDYKEIQKIEVDVTKKLLLYIHENIDLESILKELDFESSYIKDESTRLSFNIWLSMDYTDKNKKGFIELFLEENSLSLSPIEKRILEEKSASHISLFQVIEYKEDYMFVEDILNDKKYKLWEPNLNDAIQQGEFLFSRVGKISKDYSFIGDINYLPTSIKPMFLESLLVDFNSLRKYDSQLTIKEYLKKHSLNIYKIYNDSILDAIEINEDIHSYLFDELEEFETYLVNKENNKNIQKHLSNLVNLFEYILSEDDMTLYDIDLLNFRVFFNDAIEDGFINSQDELNSYIKTLKVYLRFLNIIDSKYKNHYNEILNISRERFTYMNKLEFNDSFKLDKDLIYKISSNLNDDALITIMNYEKFIIFLGEKPLQLTLKNKYIKRKDLLKINDIMEDAYSLNKTAPNQKDFPLTHFFYHASMDLGIVKIEGDNLVLSNKGIGFLRLSDEEKYSLLLNYLWTDDFISCILEKEDTFSWKEKGQSFINIFSKLKSKTKYNISSLFSRDENIFSLYSLYFKYLGLMDYRINLDNTLTISKLGGIIFLHLKMKRSKDTKSTIINLDSYRNIN